MMVVSTSNGVIDNEEAYKQKVGGEVLCSIW
jgi:small subunit ribosomal protein S8